MTGMMVMAARWDGTHMGDGWMWVWGTFMMLVVAAVVVAVTVLIVRGLRSEPSATGALLDDGSRRARSIVMERYARGEIDAAEFDELSTRLR